MLLDGIYEDQLGPNVVRNGVVVQTNVNGDVIDLEPGSWGSKLLTVTLPHAVAGGVAKYVGPEVAPPLSVVPDLGADGVYTKPVNGTFRFVVRNGTVIEARGSDGVVETDLIGTRVTVSTAAILAVLVAGGEAIRTAEVATVARPHTILPDGRYSSIGADDPADEQSITVKGGLICGHTFQGQTNIAISQEDADEITRVVLHGLAVAALQYDELAPQDTACACAA